MRPVNLLPQSERPHQSAAQANGANITIGVLGALLVAVLALVLTQNQINGRKGDVAKAEHEAQAATTRASALSSYGTFVQTKEARVQSVTGLADARFDWERFMRELALVLPSGTSLLSAAGSTAADGAAATSTSTSTPAAPASAATGTATAATPTVTLTGCASSQPRVAVLLVRLRHMYRVSDVQLGDSTETGATAAGSAAGGGGTGTGSCSARRYQFQVSITFSAAPSQDTGKQRKVSGSLGGGA